MVPLRFESEDIPFEILAPVPTPAPAQQSCKRKL